MLKVGVDKHALSTIVLCCGHSVLNVTYPL